MTRPDVGSVWPVIVVLALTAVLFTFAYVKGVGERTEQPPETEPSRLFLAKTAPETWINREFAGIVAALRAQQRENSAEDTEEGDHAHP